MFSSTNDTLRLYDERDAKDREGKKYLDASLCIHEEWRSNWSASRCIGCVGGIVHRVRDNNTWYETEQLSVFMTFLT
jgi:hypothetical protein